MAQAKCLNACRINPAVVPAVVVAVAEMTVLMFKQM